MRFQIAMIQSNGHRKAEVSVALFLLIALVASASQAEQGDASRDPHLMVLAASEIVGRGVSDGRGTELGRVESLLVAMEAAKVRYVVTQAKEPDASGRTLVAIPWRAVDFEPTDQSLQLAVDPRRFRSARRFGAEQLADLTRSAVIVEDDLYWNPDATTAADTQPPDPGSREPQLWVGHRIVRAILAPQFQLSRELRGISVRNARGEMLGELETVVVSLGSGRVVYARVVRNGVAGRGREWRPLPLDVLRWRESRQSYEIPAQVTGTEVMKGFPNARRPTAIALSELRRLYRAYGLDPDWLERDAKQADGDS